MSNNSDFSDFQDTEEYRLLKEWQHARMNVLKATRIAKIALEKLNSNLTAETLRDIERDYARDVEDFQREFARELESRYRDFMRKQSDDC